MSNRHRKHSAPPPKPTIEQFMQAKVDEVRKGFRVPMRVTIVARNATDPEANVVFTTDSIDGVLELLQRKRDTVVASQRESKLDAA